MSRVGNKPVAIPGGVKVALTGAQVAVEGPKGKLNYTLPVGITGKLEGSSFILARENDSGESKALHGLARSLVNNMVEGVFRGYRKDLEIHGVGFKASLAGQTLTLNLGYSHPINYKLPENIKVNVGDGTKLSVEGVDKQVVGQVASDIRSYYPPEPYKGKGVRFVGENVRRKEGKTVQ